MTEWLGQRQGLAGLPGVGAKQAIGGRNAGHSHPVLGLGVVDAVATCDRALRLSGHSEPTAQDLGCERHGQHIAWPAHEVHREDRPPAHRVDVGERVGRSDPAPIVRVVDDRREEVDSAEHRGAVGIDADRSRVVSVVEADDQ